MVTNVIFDRAFRPEDIHPLMKEKQEVLGDFGGKLGKMDSFVKESQRR